MNRKIEEKSKEKEPRRQGAFSPVDYYERVYSIFRIEYCTSNTHSSISAVERPGHDRPSRDMRRSGRLRSLPSGLLVGRQRCATLVELCTTLLLSSSTD